MKLLPSVVNIRAGLDIFSFHRQLHGNIIVDQSDQARNPCSEWQQHDHEMPLYLITEYHNASQVEF